jgi:nucleoside-diphosphate-sugar epimerase
VTGGLASELAKALLLHGWSVRGLSRDPEKARPQFPELAAVDWRAGDAMRTADVRRAAEGAALIFHGTNPPRYRNWRGLAIPMLANSIDAAKAVGARIVLPGNLYNFGPNAPQPLREDTPQRPSTHKGRIRVEMEQMLREARSLVVRAGDFFGPHAPGSWLSNAVVQPGRELRSIVDPGSNGVGHAWAYLPDLAEGIARLADSDEKLAQHEVIHFRGHWLEDGREMMESLVGNYSHRTVVRLSREVAEMHYLWQYPLALDNTKLAKLIGAEPHTPLDPAVTLTLQHLGCLPKPV